MHQKLQHNFDVIQYLVNHVTPAQWSWRNQDTGWSLGEIVRHLRNVEKWHATIEAVGGDGQGPLQSELAALKENFPEEIHFISGYGRAFAEYAHYRRGLLALLEEASPARWQAVVRHRLFGRMTLAELVEKIDDYDQAHVRQIEGIFHAMPLNPLLARALFEISDYHRRYQPHLAQAASLLDIGVGPGLALRHIMQHNPHLTFAGVDIRDLRLPQIEVPLRVYDGITLPFAKDQFDISLLFYVLHHCLDPRRLLAEAVRVTRQKLILIEEFDQPGADETSLDLTERQSHRALGIPPDLPYQLFDKAEFESMLHAQKLIQLEQQLLPSETTRPVEKHLYVVAVGSS